ncbi:hypothetical protein RRG08_014218 [Elysia crispata]|uniref:Uncharacterized protein n=1 Tax=Elysia crispata TaxID=231223 RepID=A0AAE0XER0_9GAST|nr:hypothetical protein RRG08_014218 [Elysia crispata]
MWEMFFGQTNHLKPIKVSLLATKTKRNRAGQHEQEVFKERFVLLVHIRGSYGSPSAPVCIQLDLQPFRLGRQVFQRAPPGSALVPSSGSSLLLNDPRLPEPGAD